jgi:4-carboxymuconolactone decarboxylase
MHVLRFGVACCAVIGYSAWAEERLPTIPPAQYSAAQKQAAADFEAARKVSVFGPFEPPDTPLKQWDCQ